MRGNRFVTMIAVGAGLALAACGGSDVTVQVLREGADGPVPEANLSVFFYPFDRDSVFDALDGQAATPKPEFECLRGALGTIGKRGSFVKADTIWRGLVEACASLLRNVLSRGTESSRKG